MRAIAYDHAERKEKQKNNKKKRNNNPTRCY